MNYKVTYNWLLEYIDTDASPEEIQEYVSLSGPNVETIKKIDDDYVFDIEVTSNRIDAASVFGFAQECAAILPRYGKKATIKQNPLSELTFAQIEEGSGLNISINIVDEDVSERISAVIIKDVSVEESSDLIKQRLEACDERPINNVVDISNYLRIALGNPVHIFDYDGVRGAHMDILKSSKNDIVVTLDGKEIKLPGNDIIIKDGDKRIIDLAGLMGGQNTEVKSSTKNILLFVPNFDKYLVRKTSMTTGQRSNAVSYFEKGLDPERIEPTLVNGVQLLEKATGGKTASKIYDLYPSKFTGSTVNVHTQYINNLINVRITDEEIIEMLRPLGFESEIENKGKLKIRIPSYREKDVVSQADIAEEVARIFGYANIPAQVQTTDIVTQPLKQDTLFNTKRKIQDYLSSVGFNEQYNYSMISKKQIENIGYDLKAHLRLKNTISTDIEYMRTRLTPSLLRNIKDNQGYADSLHFFELARVYKKNDGELPIEDERLGIITTGDFYSLKGHVENILQLLKIKNVVFKTTGHVQELEEGIQSKITDDNDNDIGHIGQLKEKYRLSHKLASSVQIAILRLDELISHSQLGVSYEEPNTFATIKLDLTYSSNKNNTFEEIHTKAFKASPLLKTIKKIDQFKDKITLRLEFEKEDENITDADAVKELEKIKIATALE